jgi:hypothetical protein
MAALALIGAPLCNVIMAIARQVLGDIITGPGIRTLAWVNLDAMTLGELFLQQKTGQHPSFGASPRAQLGTRHIASGPTPMIAVPIQPLSFS